MTSLLLIGKQLCRAIMRKALIFRPTLANLISSASSIVASTYAPSDADGIFTPNAVARNRFYEKTDRKGVL